MVANAGRKCMPRAPGNPPRGWDRRPLGVVFLGAFPTRHLCRHLDLISLLSTLLERNKESCGKRLTRPRSSINFPQWEFLPNVTNRSQGG